MEIMEVLNIDTFPAPVRGILIAAALFTAAYFAIKTTSYLIVRFFNKKGITDTRHISVIQLVKYCIWIITLIFIFQAIGMDITFIVASSAALLVGIGLGLQDVFKDFISGIVLLIEGTIKVDDIVEVDGMVVLVNEISIRTSKVTTREDNVMIIPNHKFVEEKIVNWTNNTLPTRFTIEVGVDYKSEVNLIEKVLIECALSHEDVLRDEVYFPFVRFHDFGNSALSFRLIFYSFNLFRIENVKSKLRFKIINEFRENNISIPFPQHVIHYADKVTSD